MKLNKAGYVLLSAFLLLASFSRGLASDSAVAWSQIFHSSNEELPSCFTVSASGSVYIASYNAFATGDFWLIRKLDRFGRLVWTQSFFANSPPAAMATDASENVFVTGTLTSPPQVEVTIKIMNTGDIGWVQTFQNVSGQAVFIDSGGNCWVGGPAQTSGYALLELDNQTGDMTSLFTKADVFPASCFFTVNGALVLNGTQPSTSNPAFEVMGPNGSVVCSGSKANTISDTFHFILGSDSNGNVYQVIGDFHTSHSYTINAFSSTGSPLWTSQPVSANPISITASDASHIYVFAALSSSFAINGYDSGGAEFMNTPAQLGLIAADGPIGVVTQTEANAAYNYSEFNTGLQTLWNQSIPATPQTNTQLQVINGTVYSLGSSFVNGKSSTFVSEIGQGVKISSFIPSVTSLQGGQNLSVTLLLNDVAPVGGISVALSGNSYLVGLPNTITMAAGKSSSSFGVKTLPVDAAAVVTISAQASGSIRSGSVTLLPAVLNSLTLTSSSVKGGQTTTGTVHLSGLTGLLGRTVVLTSNSSAATVPATVGVVGSTSSATFTINTTSVSANTPVVITAKLSGVSVTANLTVTP